MSRSPAMLLTLRPLSPGRPMPAKRLSFAVCTRTPKLRDPASDRSTSAHDALRFRCKGSLSFSDSPLYSGWRLRPLPAIRPLIIKGDQP
jgi:hypothetical protein